MNTSLRPLTVAACLTIVLALTGCEEPSRGPKRADDKAAHSARYHPDVSRHLEGRPATQPADATASAPEEIDFMTAPGPVGSPILFVNADTVTISDVLEPIIDELRRQARVLSERDYRDSVVRLVRNQIDVQVSGLVVYQQARTRFSDKKIQEAFDKEVEKRIKEIINDRFGGVFARYEQHLKSLDFTLDDMKERVRRQLMVQEFLRERLRPMLKEPLRRELLRYYENHLADFTTPEKAELFLIEIPLAEEVGKDLSVATADERETARTRARERLQRARDEIESGVEFGAVARAYSRGPLASQGGAWGEISPGSLAKRWAKAADVLFTLRPDQVSGIVETDESLFIVKCGRRTPHNQLTFEQAQAQLVEKLMEEQFNRLRNKYVTDLLRAATIRKDREFLQAVLAAAPRPARSERAERSAAGGNRSIP